MQFSRKNMTRRLAVGAMASCLTVATFAHAALSSIGDSDVSFLAVGPGGLKIEGKTSDLSASENAGVVIVTVGVDKLKTGIDMRDDHLRKAINANQHGDAILKVKRSDLKFPADNAKVEGKAVGDFTLNGVTQKLPFAYKVARTGSDYHVQGLATVDYTKHKLEKPCYLGVCVDKEVKLKVQFKVREK